MPYSRYYRFKLSDSEKKIYDALVQGIEKQERKIHTPSLVNKDYNKILFAVKYDNPQFFYVDFKTGGIFTTSSYGVYEMEYYYTGEQLEKIRKLIDRELRELLNQLKGVKSSKAYLMIHDWLVQKSTYGEIEKRTHAAHSILGPLLDHKCVCEGYAKAYKYICDLAELRCILVCGKGIHPDGSSGGHAWNVIKIGNVCYHVDVTFDGLVANQFLSRAYFMLSTDEILYDHEIDKTIEVPDCPKSGSLLKKVCGTKELIQYLQDESKRGVEYSEVRLSKGFPMETLMNMIKKNISFTDVLWYGRLKSYWYSDNAKTLFVVWK